MKVNSLFMLLSVKSANICSMDKYQEPTEWCGFFILCERMRRGA